MDIDQYYVDNEDGIITVQCDMRQGGFLMRENEKRPRKKKDEQEKKPYEPPRILTYSGEELLKDLGPAQACRGFTCPVSPTP